MCERAVTAHNVPSLHVLFNSGPPHCSQHSTDTSPLIILLLSLSLYYLSVIKEFVQIQQS